MSQITNIKASGGGTGVVETLTANSGVATAVANNINVFGDGTNISTTASGSTLTIDFIGSSGGIVTLDGNSGSATGSTVTIETINTNIPFVGSGSTLSIDFSGVALGTNNTIIGQNPTTSGGFNTVGLGNLALSMWISGNENTAIGVNAMQQSKNCSFNTCIGAISGNNLATNNSNYNTLIGCQAAQTLGNSGVAVNNIALGYQAGQNWTSSESNNIAIGSAATTSQSNRINIGTNGTHNSCFITGIQAVTVTGTAVLVSAGDQLGVAVSSRKYKENIEDMGDISEDVLALRPVTFNLKDHEDKTLQYGLIAEEVAETFPGLVVNDKEGNPQTVKYHELPVLLLNELQKSIDKIAELEQRISSLESIIRDYN